MHPGPIRALLFCTSPGPVAQERPGLGIFILFCGRENAEGILRKKNRKDVNMQVMKDWRKLCNCVHSFYSPLNVWMNPSRHETSKL